MKLKEILPLIKLPVILEKDNKREMYDSSSSIQEERMNHIVKSIKSDNNTILVILGEPINPKTLEELGYSFESGM